MKITSDKLEDEVKHLQPVSPFPPEDKKFCLALKVQCDWYFLEYDSQAEANHAFRWMQKRKIMPQQSMLDATDYNNGEDWLIDLTLTSEIKVISSIEVERRYGARNILKAKT